MNLRSQRCLHPDEEEEPQSDHSPDVQKDVAVM